MHAKYRVLGGEDVSHKTEGAFLKASGYQVRDYTVRNSDVAANRPLRTLTDMTFNRAVYKDVKQLVASFRPDVVYVNNTFPALSPSAILAAKSMDIPVVQVLRNYRIGCIAGTTFREGKDCQLCVGRAIPLSGIRHACYRDSRAASTATTLAKMMQSGLGLLNVADAFIAVSEYVKAIAVASGLESDRIVVRPNLVWPDPLKSTQQNGGERSSFVFVGRDSPEKGLHVLLAAAALVPDPALRIDVYGCAQPAGLLDDRVVFHGAVEPAAIAPAMAKALAVVVPSIWPEPFGRVVIEALSCGSPVIASNVGGMADFVGPGVTLVKPNDPRQLALAIVGVLRSTPPERLELSAGARRYYDQAFAPDCWLNATEEVFGGLLASR
ncbi:glycosyltransferase [Pseudarthrobacter sp. L1SW]|uniref:glycosyltransferase n=1 Tax=Pseudarthrobacter sp. L1SW TaxID=2851598 RepID=UPI0021071CD5|nr:glycosyltransferase [Pseudarthrobacter sp. L1SW]